MGDDDHGLAELAVGIAQKLHDLAAVAGVQVARGLVGEHHRRRVHEGATDGHALLLAAGELAGQMPLAAGEPQPLHEALQAARVHRAAVQGHGQRHVLHHVQYRHEVVELVHQPHLAAAEHRQLLVGARVHVGAVQQHMARGGPIHAADEVQQG